MIIATEDSLGEATLRRVLAQYRPSAQVTASLGLKGKGYLQRKAEELNRTARSVPVIVLIDLDGVPPCPAEIAASWFPNGVSAHMMFRAAVFEVESWLMADRQGMAQFLGISQALIPQNPDAIPQPKEFLVNLARRSRMRTVREDVVPQAGASIPVGPGYNSRLLRFVEDHWDPHNARAMSASLRRFTNRLAVE